MFLLFFSPSIKFYCKSTLTVERMLKLSVFLFYQKNNNKKGIWKGCVNFLYPLYVSKLYLESITAGCVFVVVFFLLHYIYFIAGPMLNMAAREMRPSRYWIHQAPLWFQFGAEGIKKKKKKKGRITAALRETQYAYSQLPPASSKQPQIFLRWSFWVTNSRAQKGAHFSTRVVCTEKYRPHLIF